MNCPNCGTKIPYNNAPCPSCGHNPSKNASPSSYHQPLANNSPYNLPSAPPTVESYTPERSYSTYTPPVNPYHRKPKKKKWPIFLVAALLLVTVVSAVAIPLSLSVAPDITVSQLSTLDTRPSLSSIPESIRVSSEESLTESVSSEESLTESIPSEENAQTSSETVTPSSAYQRAKALIPYFDQKYWFNQCTDTELQLICDIYEAVINLRESVEFSEPVKVDLVAEMFALIFAECPEMFHFDNYVYYYRDDITVTYKLDFSYDLTESQFNDAYARCKAVIDQLCSDTVSMTDFQKEAYVFEYITSTCTYDAAAKNSDSVYGVLLEQTGKCDGFARTFKWAMDALGIQCLYVDGEPKTPGEMGHAWNIVLMDGKAQLVDVTHCVPMKDDKDDIRNDMVLYHSLNIWDEWHHSEYTVYDHFTSRNLPRCTDLSDCYYAKTGQIVYAGEDIYQKFAASLNYTDTKQTVILQFESKADYESFQQNLNDYCTKWYRQSGFHSFSSSGTRFDTYNVYVLAFDFK